MIARLEGRVNSVGLTEVVVTVHGIGYRVFVPLRGGNIAPSDNVYLYTHLAVRENALDLYGFLTEEELGIFELLITLPKIGPKSALQILAQAEPSVLREAAAKRDSSYLAKMSGIGAKTAERIVAGLAEKFDGAPIAETGAAASNSDVIDALLALGYSPQDARTVLPRLDAAAPVREQIREALRLLAR